jgi:hypothetical protein
MFVSRSFVDSGVMFGSLVHSESVCACHDKWLEFHSFSCGYAVFSILLERLFFHFLHCYLLISSS